mmetsp:Transcript_31240/g.30775  ORF Transcript_31240/g.30775 Transcript_31240/m.30775 type:complete len:131 (+) Transcript_31240:787-1179(+)
MTPFTDFLTYKEGIYHPQESAFKFNGQQALKIVGWEQTLNGEAWIIENSWGPTWGEKGYAKVMAGIRDIGLDFIGIAPMPTGSNAADWEVESEKLRQDYAKYAEAQKAETEEVEGIEIEDVEDAQNEETE